MKKLILLSLVLFIPVVSFAAPVKQKPMVLCAAKDGSVKAKLKCTKKEVKLSLWHLIGQKGEKGDKGDKGDTGARGAKGDRGADGRSIEDFLLTCQEKNVAGDLSTVQQNFSVVDAYCNNGEMMLNWSYGIADDGTNQIIALPIVTAFRTMNYDNVDIPRGIVVSFNSSDPNYPIKPLLIINCCKIQ